MSIEKFIERIRAPELVRGEFVDFNRYEDKSQIEKDVSSKLALQPTRGLFRKKKKRRKEKLIWEYLMLGLWNKLLTEYNKRNRNRFKILAPKSRYIEEDGSLVMDFCPGYVVKRLSSRKRETIKYNKHPTQVTLALACHLGALCKTKEKELLEHGDLDLRHLIFDSKTPCLYVIDLERARKAPIEKVREETEKLSNLIKKKLGHKAPIYEIEKHFYRGYNSVKGKHLLHKSIANINSEYRIKIGLEERVFEIGNTLYRVDSSRNRI